MSEKLFKKLVVSTLLLLLGPVLTLLGCNERVKELQQQLAQARVEAEQGRAARHENATLRQVIERLKAENARARALLGEVVDVTSARFSEFGEQRLHSETVLQEAQRAERIANLLRAIRAFLAQSKAEGTRE